MKKNCAYCGLSSEQLTRDHVVPNSLYPPSRATSKVPRLTVPACRSCNQNWSDDEAHFRNVLIVAGDANDVVRDLWNGKVLRSFRELDGRRRINDLWQQMQSVETPSGERRLIFPANDDRFLRILKKIVRGLHFHELSRDVSDGMVHVDLLRWKIPQEFIEPMPTLHRESDVFEYQFELFDAFTDIPMSSAWLLRFFETRQFIGCVWKDSSGI